MEHGTRTMYVTGKCRCAKCKAADSRYQKKRRAAIATGSKKITHGRASSYKSGCRCSRCRAAHEKWQRRYRKSDATPIPHGTVTGYANRKCRCVPCTEAARFAQIEKLYGLSREGFHALLERQEGRCAGCREPFDGTPHVDHNHATGAVRGLLCRNCNLALGLLKDSPQTLGNLVEYLGNTTQQPA